MVVESVPNYFSRYAKVVERLKINETHIKSFLSTVMVNRTCAHGEAELTFQYRSAGDQCAEQLPNHCKC